MPKFEPTPAGVLVTGIKGKYDSPRDRCFEHIFLTRKPVENKMWHSGWQQGAYCLVCDEAIHPMDAAWWLDIATPEYIDLVVSRINKNIERLRHTRLWLRERRDRAGKRFAKGDIEDLRRKGKEPSADR